MKTGWKGNRSQIAVFRKRDEGLTFRITKTRISTGWHGQLLRGLLHQERTGYQKREMITFCFLSGLGGCEAQLTAHASGNMGIGNSREFLIDVISPVHYIGYPGSLNAISRGE